MRRLAVLTIGVVLLAIAPAHAQYFGRNKVQYEKFDFRILETPHFEIYYYPAERDAAFHAARLAERWYERLSRALHHQLRGRQPIIFYASASHFAQTTVIPGFIGEGIGGVTEHQRGRIVMPFATGLGATEHVLGHELVHAFQRDILDSLGRSMVALPLWFLEGMAEYLTIGQIDPHTAMWLRDAAMASELPTLDQLDDPRWFPYRYGQALWSYLADRFGDDVVVRALKSGTSRSALGRLTEATGVDPETLSKEWHEAVRSTFAPEGTVEADRTAPPLIGRQAGGGRLNVSPALSPDGRDVVFLSERDQYSVDVYLADATTGAVKRRLIETAGTGRFDTLQFMGSAGAWDRAGARFALAVVQRGQPVLTILDVRGDGPNRELVLEDLDEVFSPSWSPDGRRLVFSALKGGLSDLFLLDLDSGQVRPLTSDAYADVQPAWSADGRTIAFATDRFASSLDTLSFGHYRLASLDVESGELRELPGLDGAKHINPQWSADGGSLYFVSDAGSRSNVYRLHLASGHLFRVTDVVGGVSGVMALSPALSVARDAKRMAFTAYRRGAYELHVVEAGDGVPISAAAPQEPRPGVRADAVRPPTFALLDGGAFRVRPYEGGLSLRGVGQPYLSAGGGGFGSFIRAGIGFSFGDMLGEHALHTALQVGKGINDFAAQATYVNRQSRWNWAVSGQQVPSLLGASRSLVRPGGPGAAATVTTSSVLYRQIHRQLSGIAIYPFSQSRRVELSTGVHAVSLNREETRSIYSSLGERLSDSRDQAAMLTPLTLIETGAALVYDSAVLGPTSPVLGKRYRFELAPTLGGLRLATVTADYRQYWMPARPFTVAVRLKHVGRYGRDARDLRLLPLVYNLRDSVRGHDVRALRSHACAAADGADCSALQYLGTRRLLVSNVELRFPLLGVLQRKASYGPLPLEGIVFADGGWFWAASPGGGSLARLGLQSLGAGVRLNAAGFIFELAGARPFGGAARGWTFAVNFRPGF